MKYILIFILIFQNYLFAQQNPDPAVQIITEEMIKQSGITSAAEILSLADRWNTITIDGSTNFFSANNLSTYSRQNAIVMIDGEEINIGIFDVQNLNLLPLTINQIDYVELLSTPQIYNGKFIQNGLIHIHTKTPGKGLSFHAAGSVGDETGDPGPLVFTKESTPNVDKLSQTYSAGINAASDEWQLKGSIKHEEYFETDPAINDRISFLNKDDNKTKDVSYFINLGIKAFNGNHRFTGAVTSNDDYFFFAPSGNEIPVKQQLRHLGINGNFLFSKIGVNYAASLSVNELGYLNNSHSVNFDFGEQQLLFNAEIFYRADYLKAAVGTGFQRSTAVTSQNLIDKNNELRNLYGRIDLFPSENISQSFGMFVSKYYDEKNLKGFISSLWKINRGSIISTAFSFSEINLAEENNFIYWRRQGYRIDSLNVNMELPGNFNAKKIFTADLNYRFTIDSLVSMDIGTNFRSFSDFYAERQYFQYDTTTSTFNSATDVYSNQYLKVLGASAGINFSLSKKSSVKIFYNYRKNLNGSNLLKQEWEKFPEHNVSLRINFNPFDNFGIAAGLKYFSSMLWYNYIYSEYQSRAKYKTKIKPGLLAELSSGLWMWNKKIWINVLLRNLFNEPEQYHPAGADLDLRLYLQAHLYFNSVLE